jgi:putative toxin-antitoxin system antitoxin component (TIGR02293 family)
MVTQTEKEEGCVSVAGRKVRAYRPSLAAPCEVVRNNLGKIPEEVFSSRKMFIDVSRKGIPGDWVKSVVEATGLREAFLGILNIDSGNLSRVYRRKALSKEASEEVLDAVRLLRQAAEVWESYDLAMQWFKSSVPALGDERPINLIDTFEGRRWISQVLNKIEHGDFS